MDLPKEYRDAFLCGDCLEILPKIPDESVDLILTDPPYGIDYQSNRPVKRAKMAKFAGDKNLSWLPDFVNQAFRLLKPDRHFYCFTRFDAYPDVHEVISRLFTVRNCLIWVKQNHGAGDLQNDYSPQYEMIVFATKGDRPLRGKRASNVLYYDRVSATYLHPAQKPIDLLRFLIEKSTEPGEIVLDPFAGVGSTGVACKMDMLSQQQDYRPRLYLMIEVDQGYQKVGEQRIQLGGMAREIRVFRD